MTKEMLQEFVKELKRKNKLLFIGLLICIALLVGMTIFAFSEFHIAVEKTTIYAAEQNADTQGDNSAIEQTIDTSGNDKVVFVIACAVVIGLLIITVGGCFIYGKSTSKNNNKKTGSGDDNKNVTV